MSYGLLINEKFDVTTVKY